MNTQHNIPLDKDIIFNQYGDNEIIPGEVPLKDDEVLTLFGVQNVNDINNSVIDTSLNNTFVRITELIAESTKNKYLTYNKKRVIGVRKLDEILVNNDKFFLDNTYYNTNNVHRLREGYGKEKLEICVVTENDNQPYEWIASPPTLVNFSIIEIIEKKIYK